MSRRIALRIMLACSLVACAAAAVPAALAAGTGLWVTQRDVAATSNVAALRFGAQDNSLSAPLFAGAGGSGSFGIAITPDGAHLYVTNDNGQNSLSQYAVAPSTGALTALTPATVAVSVASTGANPEDVTVDSTGRWAYVANPFGPSVSQLRIDPSTGALTLVNEFTSSVSPAVTLTFPTGLALSPDRKSLYVTDYGAGVIAEFDVDPLTGAITPKSTPTIAMPAAGATPRRIATATIGGTDYAYVSDFSNGQIVQFTIDPATGELTQDASVSSDAGPTGLAVDTGSMPASLYVAAEGGAVVDEYDINAGTGALAAKASPSISAGAGPDGLALAPDGKELYVGDSGDANLHLYSVASDGSLSADVTTPTVAVGNGPSTPVVHALPAPPTPPPTPIAGALTQLTAPNDCLTGNPFGCNTLITPSLSADYQTVVSPDGKNVYAAAFLGVLVEFTRNPSTGALTELGCVTSAASGCTVVNATGANNPRAITVSPDGKYVYTATADNALVTFSRNTTTGALTWLGCLSSTDASCAAAHGLDAPYGVVVTPDGTSVYVTSGGTGAGGDSAVTEFSRNPATGVVTQLGSPNDCISGDAANPGGCATHTATGMANPVGVVISPDSRNVYVSAGGLGPGGDVAEFSRDPTTGALTQLSSPNDCMTSASSGIACGNTSAVGFNGEEDIALSPDGRSAYLNSFADSAVIELARDLTTGALTQLSAPNNCISDPANPGGCGTATATALNGVQGVTVSPDGLNVYASASGNANAVDEFVRNPLTGALTQLAVPFNCLTENGSGCPIYNVNGLGQPRRLAVSPDGLSVYAAGQEGTVVELARTPPSADLSISESGAPGSATVGGTIVYTYTVTDHGPSAADDPLVSVTLAGAQSLNSVSSSQGSCSGTAPVQCGLGPLLAGGSATVTVTVSLPTAGTATATASVADATDVADPHLANNSVVTSTMVNPSAPVNTVLPVISGTAQQGLVLSASQGTWSGSPTGFVYQWRQCNGSGNGCTSIAGATGTAYTPAAADVGHTLRVAVTATNAGGSTSATSTQTAVVSTPPVNTVLPVISGTAQQGLVLTTSKGTWTGMPAPTYSYQWQRCDSSGNTCLSILGATAIGYTAATADVGHTLRAGVTATNSAGNATATSVQTAVILIAAPVNTVLPVISGAVQQGLVLSASQGTWSGSPTGFVYQWQQCNGSGSGCTSIPVATGAAYTPVAGDVGHTLRVAVTATNAGGSATATSVQTAAILIAASGNAGPPVITVTGQPGQTPPATLAPAVLGRSANLRPVSGTVLIRLPGSSAFTLLSTAINAPLGSTIDTRSGRVALTVALPKGGSQTGQFYAGEFVLTQSANGTTIATLTGGSFAGCPAAPKSVKKRHGALIAVARKKPTTVIRQLWGNAHGKYTTKGRYGSASVSGTIWLTQDRCDGTFVRVTKDSVIVVAFTHPKAKHKIRQGHHILARAPGY